LLERSPIDPAGLTEGARRVIAAGAPLPLKTMAARGLAPLGPADLGAVLYELARDPTEAVCEAARKSAAELADRQIEPALQAATDARVLDFFAERLVGRRNLLQLIVLHPRTDDETVRWIATKADEALCELIAQNEERALRTPGIVAALYMNARARMSTMDRLVELAVRRGVKIDAIPSWDEIVQAMEAGQKIRPEQAEVVDKAFKEASRLDIEGGSSLLPPVAKEGEKGEAVAKEEGAEEPAETNETASVDDTVSALLAEVEKEAEEDKSVKKQRIQDLPIPSKIRLATLGNAFHRAVLIRDSNKQVSMAVIHSPAITEMEVIGIAANRSVNDDIIRYIANRRDFIRHYQIKLSLVNNPKTPLASSLKILPYLHEKDLKAVSKSKGVPGPLTTQAKRLIDQRTHRSGGNR
jgi:hypothetical protein